MRLLCLLLLAASAAAGWGPTGHRVVAALAEERLSPVARAEVRALLAGEPLADISTWADDARNLPGWRHSAPWHYVNIPDGVDYASSRKERRGDVLRAIARFEKTLASRRESRPKRVDALRFLVHFVADLYQPLHVGRAEDRGGNLIEVRWFGQPSNLHRIWDSEILARKKLSWERWAAWLPRPSAEQASRWSASGPLEWAKESQALRPAVYGFEGGELGESYYQQALPIAQERLMQAAVRLAATLERALNRP